METRPVGSPTATALDELQALWASGLLDRSQVELAAELAGQAGTTVDSIVIARGWARRIDVFRVLAAHWGIPFVDLLSHDIDATLLAGFDPSLLARQGWLPLQRQPDGSVLVATCHRPTQEWRTDLEGRVGGRIDVVGTTTWDIDMAILRWARHDLLDVASLELWRHDQLVSARRVLIPPQRVLLAVVVVALVIASLVVPGVVLALLSTTVAFGFLASTLFKFAVCLRGARLERSVQVSDAEVAALRDSDLPTYTILVPVFREASVVGDLVANLGALDYPPEKLQILLLLEEDDDETRQAAVAARPPENITFVTVPKGAPQTKPKACNVGLSMARGEFLVIFDAEDRPEPDQLKKVVCAFERGGPEQVCVQAALNYWNVEENALTRLFTLEYSFWFDYMLPGLDAYRLPIPLGGTSNHFRTEMLRRLGGWDPFNVTEDADLGIRASALGYTVGVVNSTTFEEANNHYGNFVRQRSRWIKGYLQTLLVHTRRPVALVRTAGARQAGGFGLLVGGTPLAFLCVPPLYVLFGLSLFVSPDDLARYFPSWVLWVSLSNLLVGNVVMIYVSMMGAFKRKRYRLVPWALLNPLYWLLHSVAAYKALWQLITRPHYWEKTVHGLSVVDS